MNLSSYSDFVSALLSKPSTDFDVMVSRFIDLAQVGERLDPPVNVAALLTAANGLSAESGEFTEVVKKIQFQGKPLDDANRFHMKRELGDVIFYWIVGCIALGIDPDEVIAENIRKLESRYPGGKFEVAHSEVRKENDL